jgi:hypothetical protein
MALAIAGSRLNPKGFLSLVAGVGDIAKLGNQATSYFLAVPLIGIGTDLT